MNKELGRVSAIVVVMFIALFGSTTVISVFQADNLRVDSRNTRTINESYSAKRGAILVAGTAVAESTPSDDAYKFLRVYANPELYSAVTGYFTLNQGSSGVEGALNDYLTGAANEQFFDQLNAVLTGQDPKGASVELTIDPVVQQAAWDALADRSGAVVAIEPATGRILAMVSKPAYDPNLLAEHNTATVIANYQSLINDPGRPLLNRAIAGDLYAPGSVFKLVVASAAIDSGRFTPDSAFPNPASLVLTGTTTSITNSGGGTCGPGETVTIATALRLSCNIPFAELGAELGESLIAEYATAYGFGEELSIPQRVTPSVYPRGMNAPGLQLSSFGQGSDRVTPLQIAMVSAAIGNGGILMTPTLVQSITAPNLTTIQPFQQIVFNKPITGASASTLATLMVANVNSGAASNARISGVDVAGKTGTAENDGAPNTLWFTGFAPAANPKVAVAVVVENGVGFGNSVAAPIAKTVIEAVLSK